MIRRKTSAGRGKSWKDMPVIKLKSTAGLKPFDSKKALADRDKVAMALAESIMEGDQEAFLEIMAAYIENLNKAGLAREAHIGRKTIYRILDKEANPRLGTIMAFMQAV
ncbi:MAG: hypothetical protein HY399_03590 [Elusimicrobia bacterium]|nr:hypothetical protein [Elusimicrobiota bacterium]